MTTVIPFSEACERNKEPILERITCHLKSVDRVLEIGTGTAQHAIHFARANPQLVWQTSDQLHYLQGIRAQLLNAGLDNVLAPIELDVNQQQWLLVQQRFPLIYTANTFHIMRETDVTAFFAGLPNVAAERAILLVYGPFSYQGHFTSASNAEFDQRLKDRGEGSGIRDLDFITELANNAGFNLIDDHSMPANNQLLVWQRQ